MVFSFFFVRIETTQKFIFMLAACILICIVRGNWQKWQKFSVFFLPFCHNVCRVDGACSWIVWPFNLGNDYVVPFVFFLLVLVHNYEMLYSTHTHHTLSFHFICMLISSCASWFPFKIVPRTNYCRQCIRNDSVIINIKSLTSVLSLQQPTTMAAFACKLSKSQRRKRRCVWQWQCKFRYA